MGGLYEIRSVDGVASRLAPNVKLGFERPLSCHLDEPNSLLYISTVKQLCTVSVRTAGEQRAVRIFPLVRIWALTQRDRAEIAPATRVIGVDEANMREVLSRTIRLRVVGVLGLVLRFAFG